MEESVEMGPIDYILVEWPGRQPNGEVAPHLVDLVERGLIRILDLALITKGEDGSVAGIELEDLGDGALELSVFEGASSGLISDDDLGEAGNALEPGTSAALLVFENTWAAPFAAAVRRSGGQLVASGRIPVEAIEAALDAAEVERLRERKDHARTTSRRRPHRRHRRHRHLRQQPRLETPGRALGRSGTASSTPNRLRRRRPHPPARAR